MTAQPALPRLPIAFGHRASDEQPGDFIEEPHATLAATPDSIRSPHKSSSGLSTPRPPLFRTCVSIIVVSTSA